MKLSVCFLLATLLVSPLSAAAQMANSKAAASPASADIPKLVRFSGTATDETGKPIGGVVGVTFSLYKEQQGGAPLWVETQNVQADANGRYTAMLGAGTSGGVPLEIFSSTEAHWVGMQISEQRQQPRVLLLSVPYALKAADAETLGGLPASAFVHATPNPAAGVAAATAGPSTPATPSPAAVSGKGTKNYIPIWTSGTALGNSAIYQTGGQVGVGTKTPGAEVDSVSTGIAVRGTSSGTTGTGVFGVASATSGFANGLYGQTASPSGNGVYGINNATSGYASGVNGTTNSPNGPGVNGYNAATTGNGSGVIGGTASASGIGVQGYVVASSGYGVFGNNTANSGTATGVFGQSASPSGYGVLGSNTSTTGYANGVLGSTSSSSNGATGVNGNASATSGNTIGVYGSSASTTGTGVEGNVGAPNGSGVFGNNTSTTCCFAAGVFGQSVGGSGVSGSATATSGLNFGVQGLTASSGGIGVQAGNTPTGEGVSLAAGTLLINAYVKKAGMFNVDNSGNGFFAGNLNVTGKLTKGSGSFKIDHPLDPANKYLSHSFVESPDMMNVYNGNVTTDRHGLATVVLPDYFESLNGDFRYQLTVMGKFAQAIVAKEIANNRFVIRTSKPDVRVSWQVTGIRHDAYANAYRIPTEEDKPAAEQGYYLHPEVFGQPDSKSIQAASQKASATQQLAKVSNP